MIKVSAADLRMATELRELATHLPQVATVPARMATNLPQMATDPARMATDLPRMATVPVRMATLQPKMTTPPKKASMPTQKADHKCIGRDGYSSVLVVRTKNY